MDVKQEQIDFHEETVKIDQKTMSIDHQLVVKTEKHDFCYENPQISPTQCIRNVKEEFQDEEFFSAQFDICEVEASDYFVNTSDLVNIKQEIVEHDKFNEEHCDLSLIKSENVDYSNQPCSSKQIPFTLEKSETETLKRYIKKKKYPCLICRKGFQSYSSCLKHINLHFKKNIVICRFCGQFFINKLLFFLHYFKHITKRKCHIKRNHLEMENIKVWACDLCSKIYSTENELRQHCYIWHPTRQSYCTICFKYFDGSFTLKRHMKTHVKKNVLKCEVCLKEFIKKGHFDRHCQLHTEFKLHKCELCSASYDTVLGLCKHIITHGLYGCEVCSKYFRTLEELQEHINVHFTNITDSHDHKIVYKCEICSKLFTHENDLNNHMFLHKRIFNCKFCPHKYRTQSALDDHLKVHNEPEGNFYKCEICPKKFVQRRSLKSHLKVHTAENSVRCPICFKKFSKKQNFKAHLLTHTDKRPFQCEICSAVFTHNSNLNNHMVSHYSITFDCKICFHKCKTEAELNDHLRIHYQSDKYSFTCKICFINFKTEVGLIRHISTHLKQKPNQNPLEEYICTVCSVKFKKKDIFDKHKLVNKVTETFTCNICSEPITLKCHEMVHTLKDRYPKCDRCFVAFSSQQALDTHYLNKHQNSVKIQS